MNIRNNLDLKSLQINIPIDYMIRFTRSISSFDARYSIYEAVQTNKEYYPAGLKTDCEIRGQIKTLEDIAAYNKIDNTSTTYTKYSRIIY